MVFYRIAATKLPKSEREKKRTVEEKKILLEMNLIFRILVESQQ